MRCLVLLFLPVLVTSASAQPAGATRPVNPADLRRVDRRAEVLDKAYIEQLDAVASDYEKVGAFDQAKEIMRRRLRIEGDERVAKKLEELEERDFELNKKEIRLNPAAGWINTGCDVTKDQEIRIVTDGTYRLMYNEELGADGVKTESLASDFVQGAPLGTLIGTIIPEKTGGRGKKKEEKPKPFAIGSRKSLKPETTGRLYLKVNTPSSTKAVGELRVEISGRFRAGR